MFNDLDISFKQILQNPLEEDDTAEIVVITHKTSLKNMQNALEQLEHLNQVQAIKSFYKVEGDADA